MDLASAPTVNPNPHLVDAKVLPRCSRATKRKQEASKPNNETSCVMAQETNDKGFREAQLVTTKEDTSGTSIDAMNTLLVSKKRPQLPPLDSTDHHSSDASSHHDDENHLSPPTSPTGKRRKRSRSTHRMSWEERIVQLQEYKAKHGDLLIPIRFKENPSLGKFVHNTREQYKLYQKPRNGKTKRCSLTTERVAQLEALGFVWSTERSKHQKEDWEARLQQLKDYKARHGDCLVPHGYPEDPSFAEWVHRQRTTHAHMVKEEDHHHNPLVAERMKQLEDLGFHFTVHADKWMEHWKELKEYREAYGHCQVPTHCPANPKLGRWVHTQRHQRRLQLKGKKSCMTDERVQMLDSLGFSWEVRPHHHHKVDDLSAMVEPGQGGVMGDLLDLQAEGQSIGGGSVSSNELVPVPAPGDLECTLQAHQDGSDGNQVDYFARGMTSLTMV